MVAIRLGLLALTASSALEAVAQPHGKRQHGMFHRKRDYVTVYQTDYVYAPGPTPALPSGNSGGAAANIQLPGASSGSSHHRHGSSDNNGNQQSGSSTNQKQGSSGSQQGDSGYPGDGSNDSGDQSSGSPTDSSSSPAPTPTGSGSYTGGGGSFPKGIEISPYSATGGCREQADICSEMAQTKSQLGAQVIRIYGTDCNQVENMLTCAKKLDMKVMLGLYDVIKNGCESQVADIKSQVGDKWAYVAAINVGNEEMNNAYLQAGGTEEQKLNAAQAAGQKVKEIRASVKSELQANFAGPYITSDTFNMILKFPDLGCGEADFVAANCHPFFAGVKSSTAGDYVTSQCSQPIAKACGKPCVITETGWPSEGLNNGDAKPTKDDQKAAVDSICNALGDQNLVLLGATNDLWKTKDPSTFNAEQFWGILDS